MKTAILLLILGTLIKMPDLARADRLNYGGSKYSRPYNSNNYWNRPGKEYSRNNFGNRFWYSNPDPRVRYGIQSGQLSRNELQELRDRQREIVHQRQSYWSDGYLSKNERKDLAKDQKNYDKFLNHNLRDGERSNRNWFNRWW